MSLIIAPDCVRTSMNATYLGRPAVNILDMVVEDNSSGVLTRQDNIDAMLETLFNAWYALRGMMADAWTANELTWVDLNSVDGATGSKTSSSSADMPYGGGLDGESYSANTAMLVKKVTTSARGQRAGRWYLTALTEPVVSGNTISPTTISDDQGALSIFLEAATETGELATTHYFPTVIHTRNQGTPEAPDIIYTGNSQIHDLVPQAQVASQRRRNRP